MVLLNTIVVVVVAASFPSTLQLKSPQNLTTHLVEIQRGTSEFNKTEQKFLADWVKQNTQGNLN